MVLRQESRRSLSLVFLIFAGSILIASVSVASANAVNYDRGMKLKGFTYNHKKASEDKAKKACVGNDDEDECVECMEHRADLQGLKGYEVIKCLKEPDKYDY
ncbi:MAG TPA: hypothetical protein VH415_02975 [Nitrososphaeraceae archaeon]|jgi:hypothetical protein